MHNSKGFLFPLSLKKCKSIKCIKHCLAPFLLFTVEKMEVQMLQPHHALNQTPWGHRVMLAFRFLNAAQLGFT